MFNTLSSFSVVFFILSAILILLVIFEKQCLALEDKFDAKVAKMKRERRQKNTKNISAKGKQKNYSSKGTPRPYNGRPRNFAA